MYIKIMYVNLVFVVKKIINLKHGENCYCVEDDT